MSRALTATAQRASGFATRPCARQCSARRIARRSSPWRLRALPASGRRCVPRSGLCLHPATCGTSASAPAPRSGRRCRASLKSHLAQPAARLKAEHPALAAVLADLQEEPTTVAVVAWRLHFVSLQRRQLAGPRHLHIFRNPGSDKPMSLPISWKWIAACQDAGQPIFYGYLGFFRRWRTSMYSGVAEGVGVEPKVSLHPRRSSRPVP
jgi:hypothetical protein